MHFDYAKILTPRSFMCIILRIIALITRYVNDVCIGYLLLIVLNMIVIDSL